jgi:DNA-binding response OmpR family regulator
MRVALTTATLPLFSGAFPLPNVPLNPPNPISENLPHGILLVEEYGALAVAISSALRKFASLHRVEVAHDFAEAKAAAAKMRPELFVLDLDPPPTGEIDFLHHLQEHYPEARALVMAAGTSPELRHERGTAGAIHFIEKPFDLAEFGAAVQALVGPWTGPPGSVRGTLRDLSLIDIILAKCLADSSALLHLALLDGRIGEIHFQKGQISHAIIGPLVGVTALDAMLVCPTAKISDEELPAEAPRTIDVARDDLLLPVIRRLAEQRKKDSSDATLGAAPATRNGRKILVIDDTEMLLIFVADVLATADQSFQIITASSAGEGIRLAAELEPDLVLLDYSLVDMTGDKVCQALLDNELTARIPVLMMSGHLTELARTAEAYANVVAALPKPFLSGALINTVEKALAGGRLPKAPPPAPPPKPAPATPVAPKGESPLPNGHGPGGDGSATKAAAALSSALAIVEGLPAAVKAIPPPKPSSSPGMGGTVAGPAGCPTELKVTFSLEIVALRLTPKLQIEVVRLQPANRIVAVEMEPDKGAAETVIETGFRLGQIQLAADGQIDTLRLIPTRQGFQMPESANSFAVGDIKLRRTNSHRELELVAAPDQSMGVQLIASFELLRVELSSGFEVEALLVRARGTEVTIRNSDSGEGSPFALEEVELKPDGKLGRLLVRPMA